jgi:hypothetical protein
MDFIVDALRQASPGVTTATIKDASAAGCTFTGSAIQFTDSETGPDQLTVVYASGGAVSTTQSAFTSSSSSISIPSVHVGDYAIGDYVLVSNETDGTLARVTQVNASSLDINVACSTAFPTGGYPAGSMLIRAQRAKFTVEMLDGYPTLMMYPNGATVPEPVAEGVEDLQIAIGADVDGNGALSTPVLNSTTDEWFGNAPSETLPSTAPIRAVQIVIVARDTNPLRGTPSFYQPGDALNHPGSTTADNFRRRVLSSIVEIRNLSGSP